MFFARKTSPSGHTLQLLESYRNDEGKSRHRVVVSLGEAEIPQELWAAVSTGVELGLTGQGTLFDLAPEAAEWIDWVLRKVESRDLHRRKRRFGPEYIDGVIVGAVEHTRHTSLGPELLGLHAWDTLGMADLLDRLGFNRAQRDAAAVSVINRLSHPVSENELAAWVKRSSLPDLLGEHLGQAQRDRFYRVSDRLLAHQRRIEAHLRSAQARHFALNRTLVLYDLTNSHFEGTCTNNPKAKHGANKQKRFDCVQVAVGMVFDEYGFGLAHKTFAGNRGDSTTLIEMVAELDRITKDDGTFGTLLPPTVIVDAGIATKDNLIELRNRGYAYLVNETRKNRATYAEQFAEDALFELVSDRENSTSVRVRRIEVPAPGDDQKTDAAKDYVILCKSDERWEKELAIRSRAEERFLEDLQQLAKRLDDGRLKDPSKIDQAIGRLRQKGSRIAGYYDIWAERVPNDQQRRGKVPRSILKWKRHDDAYAVGDGLMGCYVLRTTRKDLAPDRVWEVYTTLSKAEDGFRALKSDLGLRPNRHQTEDRADAHVFITVLGYHLLSFILETLRRAGDKRSWDTLRRILQTHQYATVIIPTRTGTTHLLRKPGKPEPCHLEIYKHFDLGVPSLPQRVVATSEGASYRRRIKFDGTPEAVPFYPHEFIQRQSSLGQVDPSALILNELTGEHLDPLQRLRIRNAIKKYGGDSSLLTLSDEEFDAALGLSRSVDGMRRPTVTGLLLLGTEEHLRTHLPAYEVAFQVLRGTDVQVNEFYRKPLVEAFEEVEKQFKPWVIEEEIQVGLFRVPVPNYDRRAFREALVNALVHRDFSRLGAIHVKIGDDGLSISNPGGFVEGVNLDNLLVADPRSRNPLLADAIKRIGLAERTGRGIDRIFEGMLRYGRPAPDYSMSNDYTVSLFLSNVAADLDFLKMVVEREDKLGNMPIDSLIILSRLREERRLTTADLAPSVQKPEPNVRATLEKLVEAGFLEPHGTGRGRTYTLSATLYRHAGQKAEYIRQAGFPPIQQEQMVLSYIEKHGSIKRADVMDLCHLNGPQAYRLLKKLTDTGRITRSGMKRYAVYTRKH